MKQSILKTAIFSFVGFFILYFILNILLPKIITWFAEPTSMVANFVNSFVAALIYSVLIYFYLKHKQKKEKL